ncbi:MAG: ABC transporter ATP-binding protein/permease, partial [Lachnospiraceae bacterium]|nr:ABC transporter ATP-binding protein/permease [Lachnospiraceae bacterium]
MKKYLHTIRWYIVGSLILYILEVIFTSCILFFPGYMIDHYIEGKKFVVNLIFIYILTFSFYLLICYFSNRIADYRRIRFEKKLKQDFFNSVIKKTYTDYYKHDIGEYLSMQSSDITELCQNYLSPLLSVFRSTIMIMAFGLALVIFVDVSIAAVIMIFSFLVVFVPGITAKRLSENNNKYLSSLGKYTSKIKTFLDAHDILDIQAKEKIIEIHEKELDTVLKNNMSFRKVNSLAMVVNGGAVEFVSVISFIVITMLLLNNKISVGMATVAFTYSTKFMDPIYELNVNIGKVNSVKEIKAKLYRIINDNSEITMSDSLAVKCIEVRGLKKQFEEVRLEYPDMDLKFPEKYLLLGKNGVGKSVFLRMLMGYYKPDEGKILIDGREEVGRSHFFCYVPQQPVIFDASYNDNVTIFGTYDNENLVLYESFFPDDLVERIKMNFDNKTLSGGEKQVIGLLRALCSGKQVLLLDEPFASMNPAAINKFMENLNDIQRLVIIVAHNIDNYK